MRIGINGIGVAGPTLAYWLRRFGHEPVMFEKAPALRTGGYLIDFWGLGYDIAERMGLTPRLCERGYQMEQLRMVGADGRKRAALELSSMRKMMDGRFVSVSRADLAEAIFDACEGIEAHFGTSPAAIENAGEQIIVTLEDGRRERFDLLIGADGLHSRVRELVFGPEGQFEKFLDCYVAAFRMSGYRHRDELAFVSHTVPGRQVGRVSLRNDETLVLLISSGKFIDRDPARAEQKAALRKAFGDMKWEVPEILDRMDAAEELYFDRVSQIHLPRWSAGRIGLVGDAAACPSLLAGEGTGMAMTEAYVLAGELHRAQGDYARAFSAYEERLRSFVETKQKAAVRFRGFFVPPNALALRLRYMAVQALSIGFFARRFLTRSMHDDLELPQYATV